MQQATIGGGCYWCLEAFYQRIEGIESVVSGYSGGTFENPSADDVYAGGTGHAEVVQVTFDPSVITYRDILEIFFVMHDPTTLNRQGNDVGDIYRSIILYHDAEQQQIAEDMIANFASTLYKDPIVTQLVPYEVFWPADEYMQDYFNRNPNAGYCMVIIDPKITKLRQKFTARLKKTV
ncbi:MAG: peptide-methionine (S)-S-oxide reductase MsrA [Candidatus Saccharimonadales bacterium]